mmetsp:Transcript_25831/g.61347  ORF Transcript_25831/g.61347 Transcript_25831/m.61347 type:complete len:102 (+) Transcript_25831:209-514(+)
MQHSRTTGHGGEDPRGRPSSLFIPPRRPIDCGAFVSSGKRPSRRSIGPRDALRKTTSSTAGRIVSGATRQPTARMGILETHGKTGVGRNVTNNVQMMPFSP